MPDRPPGEPQPEPFDALFDGLPSARPLPSRSLRRGRGAGRRSVMALLAWALLAPAAYAAPPDFDWVELPGGTIEVGDAEATSSAPLHPVTLPPFALSRTEVTVAQYAACVAAGDCETPRDRTSDPTCNWGHKGRDDHPINCVSWRKAEAFAAWVGARLPSEAELEYALRGGVSGQPFPWGTEPATCERAVIVGCTKRRRRQGTRPVCSTPAGHGMGGLCDLVGNVGEWTADTWHETYDGAPTDGRAWLGDHRDAVARGSSWSSSVYMLPIHVRMRASRDDHDPDYGFRLAR